LPIISAVLVGTLPRKGLALNVRLSVVLGNPHGHATIVFETGFLYTVEASQPMWPTSSRCDHQRFSRDELIL
jgi:hypothetical protein